MSGYLLDFLLAPAPTANSIPYTPEYYPFQTGRYEVKPGMFALGNDFGNRDLDRQVFQLDGSFDFYRQMKLVARSENLDKYYQYCNYSDDVSSEIIKLIISRLLEEHPQHFRWEKLNSVDLTLHCHLTQEILYFDDRYNLQTVSSTHPTPQYTTALDAIASQVQEDMAVICRDTKTGNNWVSAIHLCFPNHWSAQTKIGHDFATIHLPVGEIAPINNRANTLVKAMIDGQPMVRFAWGISTDTRLNHHPEPAHGVDHQVWNGRKFSLDDPQLYLRIERQVMWGLPQVDAALFTIRTYFQDCAIIRHNANLRSQLISAINSMSDESLIYKGLWESKDDILKWL